MKSRLILINNEIYCSVSFLIEFGISRKTIEDWTNRKRTLKILHEGTVYTLTSSIPSASRLRLPNDVELHSLLNSEQKSEQVTSFADKLKYAQINKCNDYRIYYSEGYSVSSDEALRLAMKRAVWERLMELYKAEHSAGYKGGLKKGALDMLYKAYSVLYPGQYSLKHAFLRAINTVKSDGFDAIVVDKRKLSKGNNLQFNEIHKAFINGVFSIGKAYTAPQIQVIISPMCSEACVSVPSISWIKNYISTNNNYNENAGRYGADKAAKTMPFAKIQPALNANTQWQVDGWTLPFYYKNELNRMDKLTLIAVKDAYSKKIIGYSVARSENRLSIMKAFEDAITKAGGLPFEIVVDNHSFNRTKEAENFIGEIEKIGVTWTVTENPQYKTVIERGFKTFGEQFCKKQYGYKGQGVKTRDINGLTSPEMLQQFTKSGQTLSEDEITSIAIACVFEFNKTQLKAFKKSPDVLYQESEKKAWFPIDLYERLRILTMKTEYKVRRNQINITVAGKTYEYQLNADKYADYNNKNVSVRYESLDLIYLFDTKKDQPICALKQKDVIHGAKADQTEKDIILLNKNKGRTKGIIAQGRNNSQEIVDKALAINPDTLDILMRHTTPKDVKKMAETDVELRRELISQGIDINLIDTVPKVSEITNPMYTGKKVSRKEESPFTPKTNELRKVTMGYHDDDDE